MSETLITCLNCKTEFPLTESLAAPLVEFTRRQYEKKLAQKESDVSKREAGVNLATSFARGPTFADIKPKTQKT